MGRYVEVCVLEDVENMQIYLLLLLGRRRRQESCSIGTIKGSEKAEGAMRFMEGFIPEGTRGRQF